MSEFMFLYYLRKLMFNSKCLENTAKAYLSEEI